MDGTSILVSLEDDGERASATIIINGTKCHLERLTVSQASLYKLDSDADYEPTLDENGNCYVVVPFNRQ
jgi:hypothetical protein